MFRSHVFQSIDKPLLRVGTFHPVYRPFLPRRSNGALVRARDFQAEASAQPIVPFRKQFKDGLKQRRAAERLRPKAQKSKADSSLEKWELTVGIEIHAQLNSEQKLFSREFLQELMQLRLC